jgi:transposase-like protein
VGTFSSKIISLYARGMSTREIEAHLRDIYGIEASASFVSRITERVQDDVKAWRSRPLESLYAVLYLDGIRFSVRETGRILKKVVYVALGITIDGKQDVLGLWIAETESASFWANVCQELAARGVKDILIACVDGLTGLPEAIGAFFPRTDVQCCIVHHIRNCTACVAWKDRKAFCEDMRAIYTAATADEAELALLSLEEKWGKKYPASVKKWKLNWEKLTTFFKYPSELRRSIYTTNCIESLNSLLRKNASSRKMFPNDDSVYKMLYLNIINSNIICRKRDWPVIRNQLAVLFEDRIAEFEV